MTLQQIYYLTEIADAGSINRAAEKLFLSQPALTNAVKEAEEELGFRLFNRNSRGISLTPDGTEFLARARELHQQYELLM
ncbi:MAG: LysR family transcriptional regulator, partial [Stomatobaculum longum]